MPQPSNYGRKTKVIRVPRKYEYLSKSFAVFLSTHPNQAKLWDCEETMQIKQEESNYRKGSTTWKKEMTEAFKSILAQLKTDK